MPNSTKGFASMDRDKARRIQSKGGSMSPGNFKRRPKEEMTLIARRGGEASGGNFKNRSVEDRKMAGRKGGEHSRRGSGGGQSSASRSE